MGGGVRIEKYGPQSSKSIVKPGMAHTGLVLERSTRSTKETEFKAKLGYETRRSQNPK